MVKGVIFDFDDTLVDSQETYWQIFRTVALQMNLPRPEREVLVNWLKEGVGLTEIIARMYPSLDPETVKNCGNRMREVAKDIMKQFPIMVKPGVKSILRELKDKGTKIGLVTGRVLTAERMWSELGELGLAEFFDGLVTASDHPRKPAPDGIIACLEKLGLSNGDVIFVGDARSDVIAGKRAGVTVVVVDGAASSAASHAEQPDLVIHSLSSLLEFLKAEGAA